MLGEPRVIACWWGRRKRGWVGVGSGGSGPRVGVLPLCSASCLEWAVGGGDCGELWFQIVGIRGVKGEERSGGTWWVPSRAEEERQKPSKGRPALDLETLQGASPTGTSSFQLTGLGGSAGPALGLPAAGGEARDTPSVITRLPGQCFLTPVGLSLCGHKDEQALVKSLPDPLSWGAGWP